jgi:hypothetical protein
VNPVEALKTEDKPEAKVAEEELKSIEALKTEGNPQTKA